MAEAIEDRSGDEQLVAATDEVLVLAAQLQLAAFADGIDDVVRVGDRMHETIGRVAFRLGQLHGYEEGLHEGRHHQPVEP